MAAHRRARGAAGRGGAPHWPEPAMSRSPSELSARARHALGCLGVALLAACGDGASAPPAQPAAPPAAPGAAAAPPMPATPGALTPPATAAVQSLDAGL